MRYRRPDRKNALSILDAAEREMKFSLSLEPTEESGSTIIRNIHECFRMLGDALLLSQGKESFDHVEPINELVKLTVETKRPINLVDSLRRLRNNINYYGYRPRIEEVKDAVSIAEALFKPLLKAVRERVKE